MEMARGGTRLTFSPGKKTRPPPDTQGKKSTDPPPNCRRKSQYPTKSEVSLLEIINCHNYQNCILCAFLKVFKLLFNLLNIIFQELWVSKMRHFAKRRGKIHGHPRFSGKKFSFPPNLQGKNQGTPPESGTPPGTIPLYGPLGIFLLNSLIKTSFINEKFNCLIVIITIN